MTEQNGLERSSATERLRALLDGRGVPWKDYGYENHTWWGEWHAENRPSVNGLFLKVEGVVTPEQAIEATLGRGECRDTGNYVSAFECDTCGGVYEMYRTPSFCPSCGRAVRA